MSDSLRYLLVLAACVAITFPLELLSKTGVYRRPRLLLATLVPVVAVFVAWDLVAVARDHWWYADRFLLGAYFLGLPLEEWLFFVVVPLCALLTYEALGRGWRRRAGGEPASRVAVEEPSGQRRP